MVCTSLGSLLRPLFYFLCSIQKGNPVPSLSEQEVRFCSEKKLYLPRDMGPSPDRPTDRGNAAFLLLFLPSRALLTRKFATRAFAISDRRDVLRARPLFQPFSIDTL